MLSCSAAHHTLLGDKQAASGGGATDGATEGWGRRIAAVQLARRAYSKALVLTPTQGGRAVVAGVCRKACAACMPRARLDLLCVHEICRKMAA